MSFVNTKDFLETMFVKNLSINVIATFEDEHKEPQDIFDLSFITKDCLKNTKSLIDYIKLSLCWYCDEEIVNKYPTIKKSISEDNGKYYFGSWARARKEVGIK
jgi:hypothetical protein